SSSTTTSLPRKTIFLPAERGDESSLSFASGKLRSSRQRTSSTPTAPVAPTTATTGSEAFMNRSLHSVRDAGLEPDFPSSAFQTKRPRRLSRRGLSYSRACTRSARTTLRRPAGGRFGRDDALRNREGHGPRTLPQRRA